MRFGDQQVGIFHPPDQPRRCRHRRMRPCRHDPIAAANIRSAACHRAVGRRVAIDLPAVPRIHVVFERRHDRVGVAEIDAVDRPLRDAADRAARSRCAASSVGSCGIERIERRRTSSASPGNTDAGHRAAGRRAGRTGQRVPLPFMVACRCVCCRRHTPVKLAGRLPDVFAPVALDRSRRACRRVLLSKPSPSQRLRSNLLPCMQLPGNELPHLGVEPAAMKTSSFRGRIDDVPCRRFGSVEQIVVARYPNPSPGVAPEA